MSEDEFSNPETNDVPDHMTNIEFRAWRQRVFKNIVDTDVNQLAERKEVLVILRNLFYPY